MSRSRKKVPIAGITTCDSEKHDKQLANRKLRAAVRTAVADGQDVLPRMRDVSDVWSFGKDGKRWVKGSTESDLRK